MQQDAGERAAGCLTARRLLPSFLDAEVDARRAALLDTLGKPREEAGQPPGT